MSLKVHRILHAGYSFTHNDTRIVFDPIFESRFSTNCYSFPAVEFNITELKKFRIDAVFISHFHDDHCSLKNLNYLDRNTPIYLYAKNDKLFELIRDLGFTEVKDLEIGRVYKVGEFEVLPLEALDDEVDSFFQVRVGGLRIINVVDALVSDFQIESLKGEDLDLLLWPFQCLQESAVISPRFASWLPSETPKELLTQIEKLSPRFIVPSSCQFIHEDASWYNRSLFPISYRSFEDEITSLLPNAGFLRLDPGQGIELTKKGVRRIANLSFVNILSKELVDYQYSPNLPAPRTAEIASLFPNISEVDEVRLQEICLKFLPELLRELGPSRERYFQKTRIWLLRLYRQDGSKLLFNYRVTDDGPEYLPDSHLAFDWLTEIPAVKLLSAFEKGEALTSLYIRVNDEVSSAKNEAELQWVDPLSDPLILGLSARDQISFQRAELRSLQQATRHLDL